MKFLCDRCKTRYSIGDDRVRGKILKIRCKNCANVITVREGMMSDPDAPPVPLEPARVKKPTTGAPEALNELEARSREPARARDASPERIERSPARSAGGAVGPDQRSERRSEDGDRAAASGAREAVGAARRAEEGARGQGGRRAELRTEPVSALNAAFASAMSRPPPALEEEWYVSIDGEQEGPFALVEAQRWVAQKAFDAELHCWSEGFDDWLPVDKVSHFRGLRKKPAPVAAPPPLPRVGGASPRPGTAAQAPAAQAPIVEDDPKPLFAATMASLERGAPAVSNAAIALPATGPARATPPRGNAIAPREKPLAPRTNGVAPARVKSISDSFDPGDSDAMTQLGPVPLADLRPPPRPDEPARIGPRPAISEPASSPAPSEHESSGDDLAIGEVSRVVNLADIVRNREQPERAATSSRRSGVNPVFRSTGANPAFRSTGAIASMAGIAADGTPAIASEDAPGQPAPAAKSHRRALITLLGVAALLITGVIGAVILLVTTDDDPIGGKLGQVRDIDTSRPEDPITHRPLGSAATPAPANPLVPRPSVPHPRPAPSNLSSGTTTGSSVDSEPPPGNSLNPDEVEEMARKHQDITNRCYMRSQRGADSILIGDVKKISVTLTVATDGTVSDLQLSDHGADNLGKCLTMAMRGWKFRPSAGGTFRFSLNFVGS